MPLIGETCFDFYVLQKEIRPEDCELLKSSTSLINRSDQLNDFVDTAALLSLMDLVISVDHLAGSSGRRHDETDLDTTCIQRRLALAARAPR
jgi:hypothetical protein